jgi:hypothetical protein
MPTYRCERWDIIFLRKDYVMGNPSCFLCSNDASYKCSACGRIFCIQHISFSNKEAVWAVGWKCADCFKKATENWKKVVLISFVITLIGLIMAFSMGNIYGAIFAGIGGAFLIVSILMLLQRIPFQKRNYLDQNST